MVLGYVIFFVIVNFLAFQLGVSKDKKTTKSAWLNIGTFVAGILVGILCFPWIEI